VGRDGYAWWYLDGLSDDGRSGLTIIGFIGSVFSPYYRWARGRGRGDPSHHCAMNVALYGDTAPGFAMTERGRDALSRSETSLAIGPSSMDWDGTSLTVEIDEVAAPLPSRIRGRVRLHPEGFTDHAITLDRHGRHRWWPMAPSSRIEVDLVSPALKWSGRAYFDTNSGDAPLEDDFTTWNWSRLERAEGATVLYHANWTGGGGHGVAIRCARSGEVETFEPPPAAPLPPTRIWRMPRETRAPAGAARIERTLEDAPFYSRSVLATRLHGEEVRGVHESLSMTRFTHPLVQAMLPFRMPRRVGW
jgi:carotenoid 1,2-hydratase